MAATADTDRRRRPYRRDQIIRAAVDLFHQRGYHATSMEDIGAAVGLSGPSLYRHFASKLDILEASVGPAWVEFDRALADLRARKLGARPHLRHLVRIYVSALLADPVLTAVWAQERDVLSEEPRRRADRIDREVFAEWRTALTRVRPDLDPAEARLALRGALQLCFSMCTAPTSLSLERVASATERTMLAALLA